MKLSVHGKRILAAFSSVVLLLALIPLSTLTLSALQTGSGKTDLLADHGSFDSADDFGAGKFWYEQTAGGAAKAVRSEDEGQSGSGALKLVREGVGEELTGQVCVFSQPITVTPGEEYTLTYYKKTTAKLQSYVQVKDGETTIKNRDTGWHEYPDWEKMALTFEGPKSGKIHLRLWLNDGNSGSALFDNFSLVGSSESTGNYLFNGDFEQENHAANWFQCTVDEAGGRNGGAALKVTNNKVTAYSNKIDATPNTVYNFTVWRKKDAPVTAYVQVFEFDAAGKLLGAPATGRNYLDKESGTVGVWQEYTFSHTMQVDTASFRLQLTASAGDGTAWFDDITITTSFKATEISAADLTLAESKTEDGASLFTFAVNGVTLPQSGTAYVNADPVQKLITKDYRYMFMAGVDSAKRTDAKLVSGNGTVTLRFADSNQSVYAVQKNAKKITLPAGTTFLDSTDLSKGSRLTDAVVLYRNKDGWSQTCQHSYDTYQQVTAPTCATKGAEKLTCSLCGFEDTRDIPIDATAHGDKLHEVSATSATCIAEGTVAHWHCDGCGNDYSDAAGTQKLNSIVDPVNPTSHNGKLREVAATSATCIAEGTVAHWHCDGCGNDYSDAAGTQKLNSIVDPVNPAAHNGKLREVAAVPATCVTEGTVAHWHCDGCGNNYSDAAGTQKLNSIVDPVDPAAHNGKLREVAAVSATCVAEGTVAHWHCDGCGNDYSDAAGTQKLNSIVDPVNPTAHNGKLREVAAVPPTCVAEGTVAHWHCDGCGNNYGDAAGKEKLSSTVVPVDDEAHGDHIERVDAKEATHEKDGNILYYHCTQCDRYFLDKEATEEIEYADTVVPHGEHVYADKWSVDTENHWKECTCGSKTELGAHIFGEWTVTKQPTATEKGERECVCTVCGTPMREELPTVSDSSADKPGSSDTVDTDSSAPNEDSSPKTGESMLLVMLALVLAGGALTGLIVIRRKRQA